MSAALVPMAQYVGRRAALSAGRQIVKYGPQIWTAAKYGYKGIKAGYDLYRHGSTKRKPVSQGGRPKKRKKPIKEISSGEQGHAITKTAKRIKRQTALEKAMKSALPLTFRRVNSSTLASTEGKQNWGILNQDWTFLDCDAFAPASTSTEKRFYIQSVQMRNLFTNFGSTPCDIQIWIVTPRKDDTAADQSPVSTIAQGLNHKYNSTVQYQIPYMSAKESETFLTHYNTLVCKTVTLSAGETHEFFYSNDIQRYYNSNEFRTYSIDNTIITSPTYLKKITQICFVRLIGSPVSDGTQVSIGAAKIGMMNFTRLNYKVVQGPSTNVLQAVQNSIPVTTLASEKFMNEDTGAPTTNTAV